MNKGVVQQSSDNSQVAPMEDFKQYRQEILDKANFFTNYLLTFLSANKVVYPLWRDVNCDTDECSDGYTSTLRDFGSGIYLG